MSIWLALGQAAISLIGGLAASDDVKDATVSGNTAALALAAQQLNQARTDFAPYNSFGTDAINSANGLRALLGLPPATASAPQVDQFGREPAPAFTVPASGSASGGGTVGDPAYLAKLKGSSLSPSLAGVVAGKAGGDYFEPSLLNQAVTGEFDAHSILSPGSKFLTSVGGNAFNPLNPFGVFGTDKKRPDAAGGDPNQIDMGVDYQALYDQNPHLQEEYRRTLANKRQLNAMLQTYDLNKDGTLSEAELAAGVYNGSAGPQTWASVPRLATGGPATAAAPGAATGTAAGTGGAGGLNGITEALRSTPGYQFRMDEGTRAIESSLAARGLSNSGAAQKALVKFGQGVADQTYQQQVDNLFNAANIGTGAAAQVTQSGDTYAVNAGNAALNMADARADKAVSRAGIWTNGLNQALGAIETGASEAGGYKKLFGSMFGGGR